MPMKPDVTDESQQAPDRKRHQPDATSPLQPASRYRSADLKTFIGSPPLSSPGSGRMPRNIPLCRTLLSAAHQDIQKFADELIAILRIGVALLDDRKIVRVASLSYKIKSVSIAHRRNDPNNCYFGRFAPYFERACLRSATPTASREPRTM